jgi:hypothetical protein
MHPCFRSCILILFILVLSLPALTGAAPAVGNARVALTTAPVTVTTPVPVTTVTCVAPCQCLAEADAVAQWGAGGFAQCAEHPCEVSHSVTGAPAEKYCYKQKPAPAATTTPAPVTTVTTQYAFPAITTPANQIASTKPTTSATPFPVPVTTPPAQFSGIPAPQTSGNMTFRQPVIPIGNYLYRPHLGLDSPYVYLDTSEPKYLINTFLETNWYDTNYQDPKSENPVIQSWTDYTKLTIDKTETRHAGNFRFNSSAKNVRMFLWQVSRFPFPNDPTHWQAEYIPGLVAFGPVEPLKNSLDPGNDEFQYFRINFAKVASRNPGDPPYYSGTAHLDPAGTGGRVVVADVSRLPLNLGGVVVKKVNLGIVSLDLPTAYTSISLGEFTEAEMAHPSKDLVLTCADCAGLRTPSSLETLMTDEDQKFYVRLVPIYHDDTAGIPSIPVEVTVHRKQPCPVMNGDITVKPPSARIVWYMRPGVGAQSGDHTRWVTIGDTAFWNASAGSSSGSGSESSGGVWSGGLGSITSSMAGGYDYYGSGFHYVVPPAAPAEKSWWDKMVGTFKDIFHYITFVVDEYSQLWNMMKDKAVEAAAFVLSYTTTFGAYKCGEHPECSDVLHTALDMAMVAVGLPPTLPTSSELTDMGTDYLVKLGADQLGAGEAYGTAKDLYQDIPDYAKQPMKDAAVSGAQQLVNKQANQRHSMVFNSQNCEMPQYYYNADDLSHGAHNCVNTTPDPIFVSYHPATVMVRVENPNTDATERVVLTVSDSWNLYDKETRIIPSLKPGEGISVPVVMNENYWQFRKENGGPCEWDGITHTDTYSSSVWTNVEICENEKWVEKFYQQGDDSFKVTFSVRNATGNTNLANLDETSSGKPAGTFIISGDNCFTSHSVRYPVGWQIHTTGYSINPQEYDNLFEENGVISSMRGYMRKK